MRDGVRETAADGFDCATDGKAAATRTISAPRPVRALRIPRLPAPPGAAKVTRPSIPQYNAAAACGFQIRAELLGAFSSVGPDPDSCPDRRPASRNLAVDHHGLPAAQNGGVLL